MEERVGKNRRQSPPAVAAIPPSPVASETPDIVLSCQDRYWTKEFTYHGAPIGKPRMTRRDQFIMRPAAQRYWKFKDALLIAAGPLPPSPDMVIITAWVPMAKSWSKKKQTEMAGKPCRNTPDWDNIGKGVCDALFDQDCMIWVGVTIKYWCYIGQEKVNIKILYAKS